MANITKDTFESGEINTLLAALFQFKESIQERYALGDSDLGEDIRNGYLHQCDKLLLEIAEVRRK